MYSKTTKKINITVKPFYLEVLINHMVFFDITGLTSWQIKEKQMVSIRSLEFY